MDNGEHEIYAKIERVVHKKKSSFDYVSLRLKAENFTFYTTSRALNKFKVGDQVKVVIHTLELGFVDFLKGSFYLPTSRFEILKNIPDNSLRAKILNHIKSQHENSKISEFYNALFLAEFISKELRDDVVRLGISHLVAISGYHLGVIMIAFSFILTPVLKRFYAKFCPYRNYKFEIYILGFAFCVFYFYIIGFVSSFLRAFFMGVFGFFMIVRGIKVLNHEILFACIFALLALFPSLIFSIGFYFSCIGVFYIFIYMQYFGKKFGLFLNSIFINFYLFFAMQVPVLYFFNIVSLTQLLVIPFGYAFILFYPLSFILHIFNYGNLLDGLLIKFLDINIFYVNTNIGLWLFLAVNAISILAIKFKSMMFLVGVIGICVYFGSFASRILQILNP